MGPLVTVRNLDVAYAAGGGRLAIDGIDLDIAARERVALVGESGSGKTTLALAIAGLLRRDIATVSADRLDIAEADTRVTKRSRIPVRRPGVAMVFQDAMSSLDPVDTVGNQLREVLRASGTRGRAALTDESRLWLTRVGLTETDLVLRRRPGELSGGMRQRVMLALALASRPRLLIADEPTSALDASIARDMMMLISELARESGCGLLLVTHDLDLCTTYTDRTVVMLDGHIIEVNRSSDIITQAEHPYTRALVRCIPSLEMAELDAMPTIPPVDPAAATDGGARRLVDVSTERPWHLVTQWNPGFVTEAAT
jgi:peptide/nickel transport system ATP-binding protein